ncbi:MAG: M48 family metallopeptidase [Opitutales bacterium]
MFLYLLLIAGCYTVPETGRLALSLLPQGQEVALGESAFEEIKAQETLSTNHEQIATVERVGSRIAQAAHDDMPDAEWEFVLFDNDEMVNAFALPGGKIGVYSGLFQLVDTDDDLAVVMGHEVAHVTARHGAERYSQQLAVAAGAMALDVATADRDASMRQSLMLAYGAGATVGILLPYSRRAEREADEIGLLYSARAGYDPRIAPEFWRRMAEEAANRPSPPEFLSTHPSYATRIEVLEETMPRALAYYEEARTNRN